MNTVVSIQIGPNSSNSLKYLSNFIDSDLQWHNHIKYILNIFAISARIFMRHYVNIPSLIKIYYSFVYPYLKYEIIK